MADLHSIMILVQIVDEVVEDEVIGKKSIT
jgi:hypothetical protein